MSIVTDNQHEIKNILNKFFPVLYAPADLIELRFIQKDKPPIIKHVAAQETIDAAKIIIVQQRANYNAYFGVNPRRSKDEPGDKYNIQRIAAAHADFDSKDFDDHEALIKHLDYLEGILAEIKLPPAIRVWSGNGEHWYWPVSNCKIEDFCELQLAIIEFCSSDPTVKDLPRVMRLPGTYNLKNLDDKKKCHILEIREKGTFTYTDFLPILETYRAKVREAEVREQEQQGEAKKRAQMQRAGRDVGAATDNETEFRQTIIDILHECNGICDSYDEFIKLALALKSAGYEYCEIDGVFARSGNYNRQGNEKIYRRLKPRGDVGFGTLVDLARRGNPSLFEEKIKSLPSTATCRNCAEVILFQGNHDQRKPYNLDGSKHKCQGRKKQSIEVIDSPSQVEGGARGTVEAAITHQHKGLNIIISGTGTGKSRSIRQCLGHYGAKAKAGGKSQMATAFTSSINNVDKERDHRDMVEYKPYTARICSDSSRIADQEEDSKPNKPKQLNITTYAYLGFSGHRPHIFSDAGYNVEIDGAKIEHPGTTTADSLYLDEFHFLFEQCRVLYPLAKTYLVKGESYHSTEISPIWKDHIFIYKTIHGRYNKFVFMDTFFQESLERMSEPKSIAGCDIADLREPGLYEQIENTLFRYNLPDLTEMEVPTDFRTVLDYWDNERGKRRDVTEQEFLDELYKYLAMPCILCNFPIWRKSKEPVSHVKLRALYHQELENTGEENEQKREKKAREAMHSKIIFPASNAYIPQLAGYNLLPLIQLMKHARYINAFSATIEPIHVELTKRVAKALGWSVDVKRVEEIPFTFDLSMMMIRKALNSRHQGELMKLLCDSADCLSMNVSYRAGVAGDVYKIVQQACRNVVHFWRGLYHQLYWSDTGKSETQNICTYAGATILTGADFPGHNVMILDAGQYVEQVAIGLDCPPGQKKQALAKRIWLSLIQAIGRILRAYKDEEQQRQSGETLQARKKIVVLLHNVPECLANFTPSKELFHNLDILRDETYVAQGDNLIAKSLYASITRLLSGERPQDWRQIEKEMAAKKPRRELTKKERQIEGYDDEREKVKKEIKEEELRAKMRRMKVEGKTWREIERKLHLNRYPDLKAELFKMYENQGF